MNEKRMLWLPFIGSILNIINASAFLFFSFYAFIILAILGSGAIIEALFTATLIVCPLLALLSLPMLAFSITTPKRFHLRRVFICMLTTLSFCLFAFVGLGFLFTGLINTTDLFILIGILVYAALPTGLLAIAIIKNEKEYQHLLKETLVSQTK